MSDEDKELETLKAKRLAEMQKNISLKKQREAPQQYEQKTEQDPKTVLEKRLGYRGSEVLHYAEQQYPNETKIVVEKLAEMILSGELAEDIDGGKLLMLFRTVGLNIRVPTKINIEQDGKFVSLSDKLSNKMSNSNNDEV